VYVARLPPAHTLTLKGNVSMSIYTDANNEFVISITEWCKNNLDFLSNSDIVHTSSADPWNKGKKGLQIPWNKGLIDNHSSIRKKEYWDNWRKNNPNYKDKWKINNKVNKGYSLEERNQRSERIKQKNYDLLECPHCKTKTNIGNLKRWHMDKCKHAA
jgi:hypothetical protein